MRGRLCAWVLLLCCGLAAQAAGPRFVTGKPYFTGQAGVPIGWKQPLLLYSTDPGDLSANVNHAAADALVAAAAGVWNVPVASITVAQGPQLAEHVSGQNVYFDAGGLHFPADVMASNAVSVPIAVIYDTDGSVTDTLLGAGASNPSGCRQNGVTESVDGFDPAGYITHAVIVVNGRCTGAAAAAQLQLRYQLMRVFGRVLGLAWSQTNDNVFTGQPQPTPVQAQNWPILHPLDIICGPYTYQCLPSPFTLRLDDIAAMVLVYPVDGSHGVPPGKQLSYAGAQALAGTLSFPTGEGMAGVNVLVRRMVYGTTVPEAYYAVSGVSGALASRSAASPFVAASSTAMGSQGDADTQQLGRFFVPWYPVLGSVGFDNRLTSAEPVNPLYTGEYSLGPYPAGNVQPSGTLPTQTAYVIGQGIDYVQFTVADAASTCSTGVDALAGAPMELAASGWWTGLTCAVGHVSYVGATVRPGRTFTLEVTALDAQGLATTSKLMPVLALYAPADSPPSSLPSLGATVTAFNGLTPGTTVLQASTGSATSLRFGIADQRGDGRPDFNYQGRLFYADSVAPAQVANAGGTVTVSGLGFRTGNGVAVNGVPATVLSWSANALVVQVPTAVAAGATAGKAVDVTVTDHGTGASSTMTAALLYSAGGTQVASMRLISAPAGTLLVGDAAAVPFSVELVGTDGTTPVANTLVTFTVLSGSASFGACNGAHVCALLTDSRGLATTQVTPGAAGPVTLQAGSGKLAQTATFAVIAQANYMNVSTVPESPLRVGIASQTQFSIQELGPDNYHSLPFRAITFTVIAGSATFDACSASSCTLMSNHYGQAGVSVIPQAVGAITVRVSDGDLSQTVTVQALTNTDLLTVTQAPPSQIYLTDPSQPFGLRLLHADGVTPDGGKPVTFTVPPGIAFGECSTAVCTIYTNSNGNVAVNLDATTTGSFTVQAAYGSVTQSISFNVVSRQWKIRVLSAPADGSPTGVVAATPFKVQVVLDDGVTPAPINGQSIVLGGSNGAVTVSNCGDSACEIWVGSDATATAWIIPQQPGPITLSGVHSPLVATATFNAVGGARTMTIVNQPSGGASYTRESNIDVLVSSGDGSPVSGDAVFFTVLSGPYVFLQGNTTYNSGTGGDGIAQSAGLATGYGPVVVQATDGYLTRLISFLAGTPPRVMKLVSVPPSPSTTGAIAARPFTVQVFAQDGVTPAPGDTVMFTLTGGAASFGNCATTACAVTTDAQGLASVFVTPLTGGVVGLLATDGFVAVPASFTAVTPPDVLRIVSTPANGGYPGTAAAAPFTVQVLLDGGSTVAPGRSVVLSASQGVLAACNGAASCTLVSDASGQVSSAVTPTAAGMITLQAVDGQTSVSTIFTTIQRPDTIKLVSAPTGTVAVGSTTAIPFAVQILQGDGVTPDPGKTVTFTAAPSSVRFGCGAATCSVTTAADGTASSTVTPLAPGPITLTATFGTLTQSATFNAASQPDVLRILSTPANGGYPGTPAAAPFTVQVLLADGSTLAPGRGVVLSASPGTLAACGGAASCTLVSDASGQISSVVTPTAAGIVALQAVDGQTSVSSTFSVQARSDTMQVLSAPAGSVPAGVLAGTAFAVKLLAGDGSPDPGKPIVFTAANAHFTGCTVQPCSVQTALDGSAGLALMPLVAGTVTLTATYGSLVQTVTLTAYRRPDSLTLLSAPASGGFAGAAAAQPFSVQVLAADGTPAPGRSVTLSVASSAATFAACPGVLPCVLVSDAAGQVSTSVTPTAAGTITLLATDGQATASASFSVSSRPDILKLVSSPAGTNYVGTKASPAFAVQLLAADGVTPLAGRAVVFSVVSGNASYAGCCTVLTDATGTAAAGVTALASGVISLAANVGSLSISASFVATDTQYRLITTNPTTYLAEGVVAEIVLGVQATQDGAPAAAQAVRWTGAPGLQPELPVTITDSNGQTAAPFVLGPLLAGAQAHATACGWSVICADFTLHSVSAAEYTPSFAAGATQSAAALQPVTILISDTAGHPLAGAPLTLHQTVTAYAGPCPAQGRCPAAAVLASLVTAASADANGRYTFSPLTVDGQPTQTRVAVSTGASGFTTTTLLRQP